MISFIVHKHSMKRALLFFFCVLFPIITFALPGIVHARDMKRIFPFVDCPSNGEIIAFYSLVNKYIDSPNDRNTGKPNPIADHPKFSKIKFGNHRIWYHWGFNKDPKRFTPLVDAVNSNIENCEISESDVEEFWSLLKKDIGLRNRSLMNKAAEIMGYQSLGSISSDQRKQLNAFVTLLYSIHLLGDHQTSMTSIMYDLKGVYGDIYNAIDDLAGRNMANVLKARQFKKELRTKQLNPENFLDMMEENFSLFILTLDGPLYNYKERFERLGYTLKQ